MKALKILAVLALSGLSLALLAYVALLGYFYFAAPRAPVVDDSDLRLVEQDIPDSENAAVAFLAATNLFAISEEEEQAFNAYKAFYEQDDDQFRSRWKDGDVASCRAEVDRILAEHEAAFPELHRIAALPGYRMVPLSDEMSFQPMMDMRRADLLWQLKSIRACEQGDFVTGFSIDRDRLALWRLFFDNPSSIIEIMCGYPRCKMAHLRMVALANIEDIPGEMLVSIVAMLQDKPEEATLFELALKRELADKGVINRMLDETDRIAGTPEFWRWIFFLSEWENPPRLFRIVPDSLFWRFAYNRAATRQLLVDGYRAALAGRDPEPDLLRHHPSLFQPNWAGRLLANSYMSALKPTRELPQLALFSTRAARIAVAAQHYRRAHDGAYPPALDDLVPDYLDEVPGDPFVPGEAIHYDAESCLVWTSGPEGDFDPFADLPPKKLRRMRSSYALRLDGKRVE